MKQEAILINDPRSIFHTLRARLQGAGMDMFDAFTQAAIYPAFYQALSKRTGRDLEELLRRYPIPDVQGAMTGHDPKESFRKWAGGDVSIIEPDEINYHDFKEGSGPFVMRAFHGTTHSFEVFDAQYRGEKEGAFGAVNYFSSSYSDSARNYLEDGADLQGKIDRLAERIEYELEEDEDYAEADQDEISAEATSRARQRLAGATPQVMEVFIKTEKPFVIDEYGRHFIKVFDDRAALMEEIQEEVADRHGIPVDELREDLDSGYSEWSDEYENLLWEKINEDYENTPIYAALNRVCCTWGVDLSKVLSDLEGYDLMDDQNCYDFYQALTNSETILLSDYFEERQGDCTNKIISGHIISEVIRELGFDSIILKNADQRFANMGMNSGVSHVHVFHEHRSNIKSVHNSGDFDPHDANIFNQEGVSSDDPRGMIKLDFGTYSQNRQPIISLMEKADQSTFAHESAHLFLAVLRDLSEFLRDSSAEQEMKKIRAWAYGNAENIKDRLDERYRDSVSLEVLKKMLLEPELSPDIQREVDELFARGFEAYLCKGEAPSKELRGVFARMKEWITEVYRNIRGLDVDLTPEICAVYDRLLGVEDDCNVEASTAPVRDALLDIMPEINPDLGDEEVMKEALMLLQDPDKTDEERRRVLDVLSEVKTPAEFSIMKSSTGEFMISFSGQYGVKSDPKEGVAAVSVYDEKGAIIEAYHFDQGSLGRAPAKEENALRA